MRKTKPVKIDAEGRDKGKTFLITEMSAAAAESWGARALGAMARSGVEIPASIENAGFAGFAALGLRALLGAPYADVRPLLDEMFSCIKIVVDAMPAGRELVDDDIEEVATRLWLRDEVLELHLGFSLRAALLSSMAAQSASTTVDTPTMPTSADPSPPLSEAA